MIRKFFLLLISSIIFLSSCSVQKRHYRNGYLVDWNNKLTFVEENKKKNNESTEVVVANDLSCDNSSTSAIFKYPSSFSNSNVANVSDSCSKLLMRGKPDFYATIIEIGPTTIKYIKCNGSGDSVKTISKSEVNGIIYYNGQKEYFQNEVPLEKKRIDPLITKSYKKSPRLFFGKKTISAFNDLSKDTDQSKLKNHPKSLAAIIISIFAFVPIIGWIFAHIAIHLARKSLDEIKASPEKYKGAKLAVWANNISMIGLIVGAICLLGGFLFLFSI